MLALCAAASLGFAIAKIRTEAIARPVLTRKVNYGVFTASVESLEQHGKGMRAVLGHLVPDRRSRGAMPWRVRLYFRRVPEDMAPGKWISFRASLMRRRHPPRPATMISAGGPFMRASGRSAFPSAHRSSLRRYKTKRSQNAGTHGSNVCANAMTARVRDILPGSEGGVAAAMITGETGGIDPADQMAYRVSGLVHVLSISGLHLALAGGFFFWIVRALLALFPPIALYYPIKKWAAVAALFGAAFYLLISGCEAPAVRSYIMLAMMFLAILVDRPALSMRSVMLAASIILLIEPESLTEPGLRNVVRGRHRPYRHRRMGPAARTQTRWRRTRPFSQGVALFHGYRDCEHRGNACHHAVRHLTFRPFDAIWRVIQSRLTAHRRFRHYAGGDDRDDRYAVGLDRWPLLVMGKGVVMMTAVAHWVAKLPGAASVAVVWPEYALVIVAAADCGSRSGGGAGAGSASFRF